MRYKLRRILQILVIIFVGLVGGQPGFFDPAGMAWAAAPNDSAESLVITLTDNGFDPPELIVNTGEEVVWLNTTETSYTLYGGQPKNSSHHIYLPMIIKDGSTVTGSEKEGPPLLNEDDNFVIGLLPAKGSLSHTFTISAEVPYFLKEAPQLKGRITVVAPPDDDALTLSFNKTAGTLTLNAIDVSIFKILQRLEQDFQIEVIVSDFENHNVTDSFENIPLSEALTRILPPGAQFYFNGGDDDFPTVGSEVDQGEVAPPAPGNPLKDQEASLNYENIQPSVDQTQAPEPEGSHLQALPESIAPPDPVAPSPMEPAASQPEQTEAKHIRLNLHLVEQKGVEIEAVSLVEGELVQTDQLVGPFIYAAYLGDQLIEVGSMIDPLEVRSYSNQGEELPHHTFRAEEATFTLALSEQFATTDALQRTKIQFFQANTLDRLTSFSGTLDRDTFSRSIQTLDFVDEINDQDLLRSYQKTTAAIQTQSAIPVTTLLRSGGAGSKRNLVIIGDGFQADDQDDFNDFVNTFVMTGVFGNDVFMETMNAFNIYRVNANSTDQGVTQVDSNGKVTTNRNTALDYRFSGDWNRCWMEPGPDTKSRLNSILNSTVPHRDYVFIILNETGFGGCARGSSLAVTLGVGWQVGTHEMGHMVGGLGDEYQGQGVYTGGEPGRPNLTININRNRLKWREFVDPRTPLPTTCSDVQDRVGDVGAFAGATIGQDQFNAGIWRPSCTSRMRNNVSKFNPVGYKAIRDSLDEWHDYNFNNAYVGDFNGDGRDDLVLHNANSLALYLSTGSALELAWVNTTGLPLWTRFTPGDKFYVGDFNNDGRDDLFVFNSTNWSIPYFALLRSTGSGFRSIRRYNRYLPGWEMNTHDQFSVADINGDGRDEVIVFNGQDWSIDYLLLLTATDTRFSYARRYDGNLPGWTMRSNDQIHVGDLNADGKDDIYVSNMQDWSIGYLLMLRSTGAQLRYVRRFDGRLPGWDAMRRRDQFYVGDFNTDGRDDLYVFNGKDWAIPYLLMLRSNGSTLRDVIRYDGRVPGWIMRPNDEFFVADFNGDGRTDLYVYNDGSDWATEYLGMLRSTSSGLRGSWQDDWINSWNLGRNDKFFVANFNGGSGWDDLFIRNQNWFGLLRSHRTSTVLNAIYPRWINNVNYHRYGWW